MLRARFRREQGKLLTSALGHPIFKLKEVTLGVQLIILYPNTEGNAPNFYTQPYNLSNHELPREQTLLPYSPPQSFFIELNEGIIFLHKSNLPVMPGLVQNILTNLIDICLGHRESRGRLLPGQDKVCVEIVVFDFHGEGIR